MTIAASSSSPSTLAAPANASSFTLGIRLFAGFEQIVDFRMPGVAVLGLDECPPAGHGWGPSPAHLLGAAIGACLAGSLVSMLREERVELTDLRTEVTGTMRADGAGCPHVERVDVRLMPVIDATAIAPTITPEALIERSVVAQSVRPGIEIRLSIQPTPPVGSQRAPSEDRQADSGVHHPSAR